ncbi:NADP-dependent 3-hydroxy acid dehydrogenase YdfG [Motilibacter rhizosphaerae]|uniref:NADP-dependent 3-hydroxy acid dehydrogenase YdfG n=1 Tax=Motilibacter rhizosphaerae TaxID=598652 RepID=A0A4V2F2V3_9ACTN|nr:SDR family NAD(P)-dependent oxidoreductase [Motilibacter rhizosphaerae]RZS80194.1 NADP-dependent 3-hydroxy acid dehydrogenase YdfG [Motilibacter rhizosphaerae]
MATAVVTGASSGIGEATAYALAEAGFDLLLGARRQDRLAEVAEKARAAGVSVEARPLDVTSTASVQEFAAGHDAVEVVIANAGGALGLDPVEGFDEEQWRWMYDANVTGVARTVRAFLPALRASGDGRIAVVTSVAGHQTYPGGGGYTAVKHAAAAVVDTLRVELLGEPVRVLEVAPGMVETEFSKVRFSGDEERAAGVYQGVTPLTAGDVAEAITWAVTRPAHVVVARLDLMPRDQASARDLNRR